MRYLIVFFIGLISCNAADSDTQIVDSTATSKTSTNIPDDTVTKTDPVPAPVPDPEPDPVVTKPKDTVVSSGKVYSNQRFKDVRVKKLAADRFQITGKAQIFEANFGWYVEDGHNEIKSGHQMTDAGAPEWGNFNFTVNVKKVRPNSTLHLVLFESSAKDGSRQYELPLPLK